MCSEQRLTAKLLSSMAAATNVTRSLDRVPRLVERQVHHRASPALADHMAIVPDLP